MTHSPNELVSDAVSATKAWLDARTAYVTEVGVSSTPNHRIIASSARQAELIEEIERLRVLRDSALQADGRPVPHRSSNAASPGH